MKVLSLFDGMSCGMLAFQRADTQVDRYVAYEIDKYATKVASHNFPMIEQRGDVFKADFSEFEGFDAVIGGSPCTYWSIAQTKNRETEAHGIGWELFQQYVRAIREAKPRFFIYENNKSMSDNIKTEISETFGFEPITINSALVSAQNRQRYYWVGIRNEDGTYRKANIEQPIDRGILLKDVLEGGWVTEPINVTDNGKSQTIKAQYCKNSIANFVGYTSTYGATGVAEPVAVDLQMVGMKRNTNGEWERSYEARTDGKSSALTSVDSRRMVAEPIRVGSMPRSNGEITNNQGTRIYDVDGKSITLSGDGGGAKEKTGLYAIPVEPVEVRGMNYELAEVYDKNDGVVARLDMPKCHDILTRVYSVDGKSPTITAMGGGNTEPKVFSDTTKVMSNTPTPHYIVKDGMITIKDKEYPIKLPDGEYIIRKLTVIECKRLQTVPDEYDMSIISNTQAYKCLGNGWTIEVIAHLIEGVMKELKE